MLAVQREGGGVVCGGVGGAVGQLEFDCNVGECPLRRKQMVSVVVVVMLLKRGEFGGNMVERPIR